MENRITLPFRSTADQTRAAEFIRTLLDAQILVDAAVECGELVIRIAR